ncbi:hypothetical protein BD779DRAFT_1536187 [Infundibulicybe gibba]|nr:hypothetical protein BD779DRAFT_1536187 [Infundibulicybe gibba]
MYFWKSMRRSNDMVLCLLMALVANEKRLSPRMNPPAHWCVPKLRRLSSSARSRIDRVIPTKPAAHCGKLVRRFFGIFNPTGAYRTVYPLLKCLAVKRRSQTLP